MERMEKKVFLKDIYFLTREHKLSARIGDSKGKGSEEKKSGKDFQSCPNSCRYQKGTPDPM